VRVAPGGNCHEPGGRIDHRRVASRQRDAHRSILSGSEQVPG
jgi:hypothetical protein